MQLRSCMCVLTVIHATKGKRRGRVCCDYCGLRLGCCGGDRRHCHRWVVRQVVARGCCWLDWNLEVCGVHCDKIKLMCCAVKKRVLVKGPGIVRRVNRVRQGESQRPDIVSGAHAIILNSECIIHFHFHPLYRELCPATNPASRLSRNATMGQQTKKR